jgi:hypothetical protein
MSKLSSEICDLNIKYAVKVSKFTSVSNHFSIDSQFGCNKLPRDVLLSGAFHWK